MREALLVALGGAVGSVGRWGLGVAAARLLGLAFPWGTLAVNVLGGLAMGLLTARVTPDHEDIRLLLGVGLLGGFTTFSSFSIEALRLLQQQPAMGGVYVCVSVVLSIGACWLGLLLGRP